MTDNARLPRPTFSSAGPAAWRERVERSLDGASFEKALRTRLASGIELEPLYTLGGPAHEGAGVAPYIRGARPEGGDLGGAAPWTITARYSDGDCASQNAALLADLEGGVGGLLLELDLEHAAGIGGLDEGLRVSSMSDLAVLLDGVLLDAIELEIDAGGAFLPAAALFLAHAETLGVAPESLRLGFGADPLGCLARDGALPTSLQATYEQLALLMAHVLEALPGCSAATIDAAVFHRAGAHAVDELGMLTASLIETLRRLGALGIAPADAARHIALSVDVGRETLNEVAKLRALRGLWTAACRAAGIDAVPAPRIRASSSSRMLTERDPWSNVLRVAGSIFSAAVGGADAIVAACHDECLASPSPQSRRIARNVQVVLAEESGLGRVLDPAGGSHFLERLTADLMQRAWAVAQEIDGSGGLSSWILDGRLARRTTESAEGLFRAVCSRRHPIVGTSLFPELEDRPQAETEHEQVPERPRPLPDGGAPEAIDASSVRGLVAAAREGADLRDLGRALWAGAEPALAPPAAAIREAEPFEALRDAADSLEGGAAPVLVLCLGPRAEHGARTAWVENLYAAGGLRAEVHAVPDEDRDLEGLLASHPASPVCLSGADSRYFDELEPTLARLSAHGVARCIVAGRPGEKESAWRAAGATDFVHVGIDVVDHLAGLLGVGVDPSLEEVQA
jgi:methylmalonyl-CoA mutase